MFTYKKERELHNYIVDNFSDYFGFKYVKSEVKLPVGRVDILGEDETTIYVVELKRSYIDKAAIQQVSEYVLQIEGLYPNKKVVGIAAAPEIKKNVEAINSNIKLVELKGVKCTMPQTFTSSFKNPDEKQSYLVLPKEIVEKIDKEAKEEMRSRSKQMAKIILDYYNK